MTISRATFRFLAVVFCMAAVFLLGGCAASSVFTSYPNNINPSLSDLQKKKDIDLDKFAASERGGADAILYNMESGRIAQILKKTDNSLKDFNIGIARIKANDEKAVISASDTGAQAAALIVNDNAIPYQGYGYERVMLHHYQALNFLRKRDLQAAGVEIRIAGAEQDEALKRFEDEIEAAQESARKKGLEKEYDKTLAAQYAQMDEIAGKVKNSFQNAYTFFFSGVIYELLGQPNDAYIDYKKALEIFPANRYLQQDVIRLAARLGMKEELQELSARFKIALPPPGQKAVKDSELIVIFEDGFVPQKQEFSFSTLIPKIGMVKIAFPIYREKWKAPTVLSLRAADGQKIASTQPICEFRALAVKALKEKMPSIATRQFLRLASKVATQRVAEEKLGKLGGVVANIYGQLSENADLRSWLTLPANAQILHVSHPSGEHKIFFSLQDEKGIMKPTPDFVLLNIPDSSTVILYVVNVGNTLYTEAITFKNK